MLTVTTRSRSCATSSSATRATCSGCRPHSSSHRASSVNPLAYFDLTDVEYFPFDEQNCNLIFGSWTVRAFSYFSRIKYGREEIVLSFVSAELADLQEYQESAIWDLLDAPGTLVNQRSRVEYRVIIRWALDIHYLENQKILMKYFRSKHKRYKEIKSKILQPQGLVLHGRPSYPDGVNGLPLHDRLFSSYRFE